MGGRQRSGLEPAARFSPGKDPYADREIRDGGEEHVSLEKALGMPDEMSYN
jgi:hypothetical protein